jgi:beta-ureidopropionase / N-carbamoyl-L-amino-acid hydrolase
MITCSLSGMQDKIDSFSRYGDTGRGGITRFSLSPEALAARDAFASRMKGIGAILCSDDMGNLYATLPGTEPLPAIVSGSHLDSVRQGGNYDGVLGVITAMEVAETLMREKVRLRHPFTAMVWTNEEGARFEPAMMSSGVVCGKFDKAAMLASEARDMPGFTFGEALAQSGWNGSQANRMSPANSCAFLELHIEQGPVLEADGLDIGIVEGVCGMINVEFIFTGQAGHAGTTPMPYRKDALHAAARTILHLHDAFDKLDSRLVYTTGKISAHPNIHTIIPDEVRFTLDARHQDPDVIRSVMRIIRTVPAEVERCAVRVQENWSRKTVQFDPGLVGMMEAGARAFGYSFRRMYSGPGHDAQYVTDLVPSAMLFVPSVGGHSHCELEHTPAEACLKGANVMLSAVLALDAVMHA